jgi:hypothetical protein
MLSSSWTATKGCSCVPNLSTETTRAIRRSSSSSPTCLRIVQRSTWTTLKYRTQKTLLCGGWRRVGRVPQKERRVRDPQPEFSAIQITGAVLADEACGHQRLDVLPGQRRLAPPLGAPLWRVRSPRSCRGTTPHGLALPRIARWTHRVCAALGQRDNVERPFSEEDRRISSQEPQYPPLTRRGFIARLAAALSVSPFVFPSLTYAESISMTDQQHNRNTDSAQARAPFSSKKSRPRR